MALDRALRLALKRSLPCERLQWLEIRDRIYEDVMQHGFKQDRGAFVQAYDVRRLDASLLVVPLVGFLPIDDPRVVSTMEVIQRDLTHDGLVLRYETLPTADIDGLPAGEGAFLLCTFWYIDALASVGRRDEALELFNNILGRRNHLGLLSEDIDPATGELWGNFPQTYSQVGLILSAMRLSRSWEEGLWHAS